MEERAKSQVNAIAADIQRRKFAQKQNEVRNMKEFWAKTMKIKQLRSMFSMDFGTTITEDKINAASLDPNRKNSLLNKAHLDYAESDPAHHLAAELAAKRATSI